MFHYTIILSFHVSLILLIYLCTLYINIAIQRNEKIHVITNASQFSNKWATKYPIFVIMT